MSVKVICPYINDNEINQLKDRLWNLPIYFEKDHAMIGSDMMYQRLWNKFSNDDIFIIVVIVRKYEIGKNCLSDIVHLT